MTRTKEVIHLAVRFYRLGGVELALIPLMKEVSAFARSAGDGYYLVVLMGQPGTAYPVNLRSAAALDPDYLAEKFRLDRRGYGYTPEELAAALHEVAEDVAAEERLD
jgi:hypothetical protein